MKYLGTRTAATDDVAVQNDLSGLLSATTAANTYALKGHTHTKSQITDLTAATTSAAGLLSASDKTKLDGIAAGANKTVVDTALSTSSANPVQNKIVTTALSGKAAASHTHTKSEITDFPASLMNPCALSVFGVSYDGSAAKTVDKTTLIGTLTEGTSDVTDGTQFVTSYASDNGFDETNYKNIPYKRKASCLYNYIKGKTDTLYVTALGTSGNYLTWKKGSTTTSITVPFATSTTVDTALSASSTNPVQNKVVNTALGTKLNMFTSGGVASKGGSGTYSYFKFATIKITGAYSNYPIVFEMSGRGKALSLVSVTFANENSIDPALGVFTSNYDKNFWIKKSATSTWDLYGQYSETYGNYTIHRVTGAGVSSDVSVSMTNVSALPDGCTQAVYGGNVGSATKWSTARNISIGDGTNTGTAVSVDGSAAVTLKLPGTIKAKFVSSTSSAATSFLMGDGSVTTKKNLTSVSHCGYTSTAVDALLVPTMNTIAYWNGAYNSSGSSNLAYCSKGAFGTFAAKSSLAFSELTSKPTTLSGYGITDALPLTGGTLTGALVQKGLDVPIVRDFDHNTGPFARDIISLYQDGTATTVVGRIGYWGKPVDTYNFIYIGASTYNGANLRVYADHVSWDDKTIYHAGNSNLSTVNWTCAKLTASAATISGLLTATSLSISGEASVGSLKIGDATITWDSTSNALKVDKNFYSTGTVASGV